jgi:hypothetical protein
MIISDLEHGEIISSVEEKETLKQISGQGVLSIAILEFSAFGREFTAAEGVLQVYTREATIAPW